MSAFPNETTEAVPSAAPEYSESGSVRQGRNAVSALYTGVIEELGALLSSERSWAVNLSATISLLGERLPGLAGGGFYVWKDGRLELGPSIGTPVTQLVRSGYGVLGSAVSLRSPVIRSKPASQEKVAGPASEIALPVYAGERLIGVFDLDSSEPDRFGEDDRSGLQGILDVLAKVTNWPEDIGVEAHWSNRIQT